MKSIRVGVIGVGNIGTMHADNIYQNKIEGMELTAVCDAKGIQSENIAACVKHFCVNNKETNRKFSDSRVSERALREIYLKAFEIVIGFKLPPFAYWTVEEWKNLSDEYAEMKDCQIGWDVTDFGSGDFHKKGLFLMTIRNGCFGKYPKPYAEKIMVVEENQVTPMHFHWSKMEDIINRGGGNLLVQLYNSKEEQLDTESPVTVYSDSREYTVPAGTILRLEPGQSITMQQGLYHSFWGEEGKGKVLVGEVSMCNDDTNDNRFWKPTGRFPEIEEDVPAEFILANEL